MWVLIKDESQSAHGKNLRTQATLVESDYALITALFLFAEVRKLCLHIDDKLFNLL